MNAPSGLPLLSLCFAITACTFEAEEISAPGGNVEPTDAVQQAYLGANPLVNAEYWGEIPVASGMSYRDIAVTANRVYLARSDGAVRYYTRAKPPVYEGTIHNVKATNLEYNEVSISADWGLVASDDTTRQIYANLQDAPHHQVLGSYPGGVTTVHGIACEWLDSTQLHIWITHGQSYTTVWRHGWYSPASGITWEATTHPWGNYTLGFTQGYLGNDRGLVGVVSYTTAYFKWDMVSGGPGTEAISPYTEHAYLHPQQGANDRFAPAGLDYYREGDLGVDAYYGIDFYSTPDRQAWVLTRLREDRIRR